MDRKENSGTICLKYTKSLPLFSCSKGYATQSIGKVKKPQMLIKCEAKIILFKINMAK